MIRTASYYKNKRQNSYKSLKRTPPVAHPKPIDSFQLPVYANYFAANWSIFERYFKIHIFPLPDYTVTVSATYDFTLQDLLSDGYSDFPQVYTSVPINSGLFFNNCDWYYVSSYIGQTPQFSIVATQVTGLVLMKRNLKPDNSFGYIIQPFNSPHYRESVSLPDMSNPIIFRLVNKSGVSHNVTYSCRYKYKIIKND